MNEELEYQIYKRFDILERIGSGAYGVVFKVVDRRNGEVGALKKICDAFQNRTDSQRTYREILYLSEVVHPNVVKLLDVIQAKNQRDVYLLFEFMEFDLAGVLRLAPLEPLQRKHIAWQLLSALECLHAVGIVHRDVKPSNILIDRQCDVRLCDFGLARGLTTGREKEQVLTSYIAARWYRAPEVILSAENYGFGVDLWAVGCIMAEMVLRRPLFVGESTLDQLEKILSVVGMPRKSEIEALNSNDPRQLLANFANVKKLPLSEILFDAGDEQLDLMMGLLQFTPAKRFSARDALRHPYFEELVELHCNSYSHTDGSLTRKTHVIEKVGSQDDYKSLVQDLAYSYRDREFDRTSNYTLNYPDRREVKCRSDPMFKGTRSDNIVDQNSRSTLLGNTSTFVSSESTHDQRKSAKSRSRLSYSKPAATSKSKSKLHKPEQGLRRSSKTKYERPSMLCPRQEKNTSLLKSAKTISNFSVVKEREPLKMRKAVGKKPVVASHKLIGQRKFIV